MKRRTFLASAAAAGASLSPFAIGRARATTVGVTKTEIKIGHTIPYSGPASAYGAIGHGHMAFFKRLNEQGGINGRKINLISLDDGYSPPRTVEQVRRLIEQDQVAFLFNTLGTPNNTAIHKYVNQKKVPHLFLSTGADKWGDPKHFPWTIGWQPSYRTEAQIYAKYILKNKPDAKIAILYQNDDFGKDYVIGLKDGLGAAYGKHVVKELTYEVTDATIDSQAVTMQAAGADTILTAATPKFAAQMIRKIYDMGSKPLHFMTNVSSSVGAVVNPAGPEKAVGIITSAYLKDPTDPTWKDDPGMTEWRGFMKQYMPDADMADGGYVFSYGVCTTLVQVLKQCGDDFSRENIMKQATSLKDLTVPVLLPGIKVNSSATNYHPIRQMQLSKWNGKTWQLFGEIIEGAGG
jgi:branched-chain amino acid transport system substrate-binding protein